MPAPVSTDPAGEALRRSEARYRRLFETARDGILLLNAESAQIEDVNPYLIEMLGYSHQELLGRKLWEVGAFSDIAQSKEMFAVLQDTGYVRYEDLPLTTSSGRTIAVEFVSNAYDCEGIKVIQCNIRDVTAHREAELVLREFKAIVDASDDAIISKSTAGVIRSWNPGAVKIFGYSAEEAIGRPISIIIPPDRSKEEAEIMRRLVRGERVEHFETIRCHKEGHLIDISATISPIRDHKNAVVGASKIARDVTEAKRAESVRRTLEIQLWESQKMEAIGTLAGGIAHDFNNIIATILDNADLALDDTRDNPSARRSVEEIRRAASRARTLVQQILSFSRRQPLERKPIRLQPVIEESVRLMRATFPAHVQINVHCDASVPDVLADPIHIEQVLLNLATNSLQAARGGPQVIGIHLDTVLLDASLADESAVLRTMHVSRPTKTVRLIVSDTGPGMDESTLLRVFDPFFTTKPIGEGTGLGLSVVHGIVQAHEGTIAVASEPGVGTTFTIYLPPVATPSGASGAHEHESTLDVPHSDGGGRRLIYIDDDESMVFLVRRVLERRNFVVLGFTDPGAALAHFRSDPAGVELVVSDYNMPHLSGLDVSRTVHDIRPELPIVIVSGFIDERLLAQASDAGVRELIVKTVDIAELCETIGRLMTDVSPRREPS